MQGTTAGEHVLAAAPTDEGQASLLPRLHWFTTAVLVAGLTTAGALGPQVIATARHASAATWILVALAVASEALMVAVPGGRSLTDMTFSSCFVLTLLATTGIGGALLAVVCATVVCDVAIARRPMSGAYNAAQYALAWSAAALALTRFGYHTGQSDPSSATLWALALAACVFFVVNNALVTITEACELGDYVPARLRAALSFGAWLELTCLGVAILVVLTHVTLASAPFLLLPVLAHSAARHAVRVDHDRLHDELTGLPNRRHFRDCAQEAIRRARRTQVPGAVMVLDLNGFKRVNDTLGHAAGDAALREVADRLRAGVRSSDVVARLGGDEFAILLEGPATPADARQVAYAIAERVARPIALGGTQHRLGASIGIVRFPDDGEDLQTLLDRADRAMYAAKRRPHERVAVA